MIGKSLGTFIGEALVNAAAAHALREVVKWQAKVIRNTKGKAERAETLLKAARLELESGERRLAATVEAHVRATVEWNGERDRWRDRVAALNAEAERANAEIRKLHESLDRLEVSARGAAAVS